ncbi:Smr/MutS family protein [Flagellimonas algicola]|uniref:DNA mismatch repair protein MutS n=1 Tax=Flagellimonas algicola TaxID=2583815 RepID=A0ABY2WQ94_9FLAO|nr:Smr/MutS family protein [Allomuricauda algicola]TMU57154.1 DNA mismatch repair protein MutS [Allomuricauda algicola]
MTGFQIGDKVEVLDEDISGLVKSVDGDMVTLITEDGFPLQYHYRELLLKKEGIRVTNFEVSQVKKEKEIPKRNPSEADKPKLRNAPRMEVDLHIHQLVKNTKGLSNFDMMNLQLETARRQLEFAIRKRIQKVVFIHGVGEGILKEELQYLFKKYEGVKWYDADYQKYGLGATEVYITQKA